MTDRKEINLGIFFFLLNLALAIYQQWSVTDLLWGLWISSLTLGYAYILAAIAGMVIRRDAHVLYKGDTDQKNPQPPAAVMNIFFFLIVLFFSGLSLLTLIFFFLALVSVVISFGRNIREKFGLNFLPTPETAVGRFLIILPAAVFLLGFFSFHFIFFHFIHSIFLNGFFPLTQQSPFGETLTGTVGYFQNIIQLSVSQYWMFILISGFSRLSLYSRAFKAGGAEVMLLPYKNVVRMHLTIFVLAFLSIFGISRYALYFIFVIYFLPLHLLFGLFKSKKADFPGTPPIHNKTV